jgi:hypothetical protein
LGLSLTYRGKQHDHHKKFSPELLIKLTYGLIIFTILSRLLPHTYNFTSVGALSLFAGATLPNKIAWLVPCIALLITDAITGLYHFSVMVFVYAGFILCTLLGRYTLSHKKSFLRITGSSLLAAVIFYLLSNFGMWLSGLNYPLTFAGLIECYIQGLPYLNVSLYTDLIYSYFLFGIYMLLAVNTQPHDHILNYKNLHSQ